MNANEYQDWTLDVSIYPQAGTGGELELYYLAMGLCGEAGEVANKVKKLLRDNKLDTGNLIYECGDVCFYLARLIDALGYQFEDVMLINKNKLLKRKAAGTLQGSGDHR